MEQNQACHAQSFDKWILSLTCTAAYQSCATKKGVIEIKKKKEKHTSGFSRGSQQNRLINTVLSNIRCQWKIYRSSKRTILAVALAKKNLIFKFVLQTSNPFYKYHIRNYNLFYLVILWIYQTLFNHFGDRLGENTTFDL